MENNRLTENIKSKFPDIPADSFDAAGVLSLKIEHGKIKEICSELKENDYFKFDYLMCLSGADYPDRFEVVYHLYSTTLDHKLVLRVALDKNDPVTESVTGVWAGADWHEREAFDMFGIKFNGHPNLKRILLPEDWEGYPLRKDYKQKADQYD
jgi:NADH-quinone oxidoreductase subunit C